MIEAINFYSFLHTIPTNLVLGLQRTIKIYTAHFITKRRI